MRAKQLGKTLNSRELNSLIKPLRQANNHTNFFYLLGEYATLAAVIIPTMTFCHMHAAWGFHWAWCIPVVGVAVMLIGAVQHRLAGLGHEGAHYILFKNRVLNELMSDLFCMFPLFSTTEQYRQIHLGHHEYTNDWERDPELLNLGKTRMMDQFPMTRGEFFYHFFIRILWPPALFRYMWDNIYVTALGRGVHPYMTEEDQGRTGFNFRLTSVLGVVYIFSMAATLGILANLGYGAAQFVVAIGGWLVASAVVLALPQRMFFRSKLKPVYSNKVTSIMRLGIYTTLCFATAYSKYATGTEWGIYFYLLWILPLFTSFPYYMLLRDIFQHANADDGKLTNSRVMFPDPITRWAMFVYGQDIHLTHHLYPTVPHFNLPRLHQVLKQNNDEYDTYVVECYGTFSNGRGKPSLLDVMEVPTREPYADVLDHHHEEAAHATTASTTNTDVS